VKWLKRKEERKEWGQRGVFIGFWGLCQGLVSGRGSGLGSAGLASPWLVRLACDSCPLQLPTLNGDYNVDLPQIGKPSRDATLPSIHVESSLVTLENSPLKEPAHKLTF